ncbi:unnamed protein product [Penicillium salamii]|uniref:Secreted protein n=1 Tax=Penicillium salamii TaxID=1612424 RepID=A0A9W4IIH6_9EURO|nr:unnamed protein product [Penicillium salamii]CAG8102215.1 unnamed protein product [Penicillium salamii]CAG8104225.1 unnamed protein product [Penicillium salamii]CAG8118375.1 unnamed protein product [Penicillium salamii]CAG8289849.1 unnamed protein product [Penicillium salamii]
MYFISLFFIFFFFIISLAAGEFSRIFVSNLGMSQFCDSCKGYLPCCFGAGRLPIFHLSFEPYT